MRFSRKQNIYGYLLILPAFVLLSVFSLYPIVNGFFLSFTDWDGMRDYHFVGLNNFASMFASTDFGVALYNTLIFVLGTVPFTVLLSLLFAHLLNRPVFARKFFRSVYFLPAVTSGVAIAIVWRWLFNTNTGLLNSVLFALGLKPVEWLASSKYAMVSVIIMSVWKSLGTNIVIMLAALQSVPATLLEAASMDTDSSFRKFISITLPMVTPSLFLIAVMSVIGAFQVFEGVMTLTGGRPGNSTLVLVLYIYRQAFENFKMGYASTLAYTLFFIILLITVVQWVGRKYWVYSEAE